MATLTWKPAVRVHAGKQGATLYSVSDPVRAAEVLLRAWPVEPGPKHRAAREACLRCLEGKCDAEEARSAFVAAAKEADILAK